MLDAVVVVVAVAAAEQYVEVEDTAEIADSRDPVDTSWVELQQHVVVVVVVVVVAVAAVVVEFAVATGYSGRLNHYPRSPGPVGHDL